MAAVWPQYGSGFYGHISGQMQEQLLAVWSERESAATAESKRLVKSKMRQKFF